MVLLEEEKLVSRTVGRLQELSDSKNSHEFCGTAFWKGEILYVGGYYEMKDGIMKMFIIPDKRIFQFPKAFHQSVRWWHKHVESLDWTRSIYSMCLPLEKIDKWMSSLGYVYGTTVPRYINSQDYKLWAKVNVKAV